MLGSKQSNLLFMLSSSHVKKIRASKEWSSSESWKSPVAYTLLVKFHIAQNQWTVKVGIQFTHLIFFNSPMLASSKMNSSICFLSNLFMLLMDDFRNNLSAAERNRIMMLSENNSLAFYCRPVILKLNLTVALCLRDFFISSTIIPTHGVEVS